MRMEVLSAIAITVVLVKLYLYMYNRMKFMLEGQKNGTYTADIKRSLIELILFVIIYSGCAAMTTVPHFNLDVTLVGGVVAFLLSIFIFNKFLFEKTGKMLVVFATVIMFTYYSFLNYIY